MTMLVELRFMPASQLSRRFAVTARNAEVDGDGDGDEHYDIDYDELYRDTADSGGPPWDIGGREGARRRGEGPEGARRRLRHR